MKNNKVSHALFLAGYLVILLGVASSFVLGGIFSITSVHGSYYTYTKETYNWALCLGGSVISVLNGLLFLGLSEIISLLDDIKRGVVKSSDISTTTQNEDPGQKES